MLRTKSTSGEARLHVASVAGRSAVVGSWARSPLPLLTPRSRGNSVWAYTSSFGGGFVAGDRSRLELCVDAKARCFLSTQASTKVYRNPAQLACSHELIARVAEEALLILFSHNPKAKIIWAHTGFGLSTDRVSAMLSKYPKLWGELSYRGGITDGAGKLTPEWRGLFERYPDRFLLGSDTWINERWASYGDIMATYRAWLGQLSPAIAARIAHGNARALFAASR
jgi:hypothetical protein